MDYFTPIWGGELRNLQGSTGDPCGRPPLWSPLLLTQNEWFKAQRFKGDYYLYMVFNASKKPELHRIQNPAGVIQPDEQVEVRYLISLHEIRDGLSKIPE